MTKNLKNINLNSLATQFFVQEDRKKGALSLSLVHRTINSTIGYPWIIISMVVIYFTSTWSLKTTQLYLAWGRIYYNPKHPVNDTKLLFDLYMYIGASMVCTVIIILPIYYSATWFGRRVHSNMVFNLIHSKPTEFLQRTPNGVILNRFSNDVNILDNSIVGNFIGIVSAIMTFLVLFYTIVTGLKEYVTLIPLILFMLAGYWLRQSYVRAQRETQRLSLISKSPVIGTAIGSIVGSPVIRVHGRENYFREKINHEINENSKNFLMNYGVSGWFRLTQFLLQTFVLFWPLYFILLQIQYSSDKPDRKAVAQINFIQQVGNAFFSVLSSTSGFEIILVSIERLNQYENLEPEAGYKNIQREEKLFKTLNKSKAKKARLYLKKQKEVQNADLINRGTIRFSQVSARYPTARKNVLSDLDLVIPGGQTVGIVGRTGAGKSSFIKLLWRALNPYLGSIEVDGKDIASLDVKEYRKRINIILQKPNIFEGTLLSNISQVPLNSSQIQSIREELIDLGFPKSKLEERDLSYEVKESGSNLSQSEKQIVCLMQALQRDSKIVILDEATAYVDIALEKKFQERVARNFKDSTVLIIAHKISNVMDADRVFVFDQGRVVEDGNPRKLLEDTSSLFYDICKAGNELK